MVRALIAQGWDAVPVGTASAFETVVGGRIVVRSWARREPDPGRGLRRIVVWQEVDLVALNRPGGRVRAVFDIACRPDLAPRRVTIRSRAGEAVLTISATGAEARLVDGSRLKLDDGRYGLILPDNVPALADLHLRLLSAQKRLPFACRALVTGTLQGLDYRIEPDGALLRSNIGEWFRLDDDGRLAAILSEPGGPEVARRVEARVPRWRGLERSEGGTRRAGADRAATEVPATPAGVRERDVSLAFDGRKVWGRLLRPQGRIRAAALLLGGSGHHDRFGRAGTIDLGYRDLALDLVARGIAVLQVDKPGAGRTHLDPAFLKPRFTRTIALARAWRERLTRLVPAGTPIVLIGHSEGGQVATALAAEDPSLAGLCVIATAYADIDRVLEDQVNAESEDLGLGETEAERRLADTRAFFAWVRGGDGGEPPARMKPLAHLADWYRDLLATTPERLLPGVSVPVLVLHGGADIQVPAEDAARIAAAVRTAGGTVRQRIFSDLDHLMKRTAPATNIARYGDRRRRVAKPVTNTIADWLAEVLARRPAVADQEGDGDDEGGQKRDGRPPAAAGEQAQK
ncbi:alpha/beta hydrolase [Polymorphum gilvum]|uniref:Alpha/beta hydrolase fold protein n=1 Tax=Polymorphum gilvum (strain LMG 25793 / CGMCC 1.9160 / SL003B-26A1) TaxID=991905 RepID=F2IY37_POLGS|nr:alpha/beta fold hydrolase [Polymorphum gilvum]ADZ70540.1 Alpha/beta hydrolase fold protein [Polymorphum gilvum SL003B-26A1]